MRGGRLLSSAMARGTAFGSMLNAPRCAAPGVATFSRSCFIGDAASEFSSMLAGDFLEPEFACESRASTAAAASAFDCGCCAVGPCLAACFGCGYSAVSLDELGCNVGKFC